MHILFVCTGNICRSPMAEILMRHYLAVAQAPSVLVESAGTHGLRDHPIDPQDKVILDIFHLESESFRSRRLNPQIASSADLILCFERNQRKSIVSLSPGTVRRTFLLSEFAQLCTLLSQQKDLRTIGTPEDRFKAVIESAPFNRLQLNDPQEIEDPHGKNADVFLKVSNEIDSLLLQMMKALF